MGGAISGVSSGTGAEGTGGANLGVNPGKRAANPLSPEAELRPYGRGPYGAGFAELHDRGAPYFSGVWKRKKWDAPLPLEQMTRGSLVDFAVEA